MESLADVMSSFINRLLEKKGECPNCSEPLYTWKNKRPDGSERGHPTCMSCGYKNLQRTQDMKTAEIYNNSLRTRAMNFFKNGSIITDKKVFDNRLANYKVVDHETEQAKQMTESFINSLLNGETNHLVLTGKSGSGKSHLSMSVCWEVIEQSNYEKKCLFINYRELLEQLKFSFNDEQARKAIQGNLISDIKTTDLVVIDDLGSELGGTKANMASTYNNDILYSILEARQNLPLVVNTNLTSEEIKESYGERILSRILRNAKGCIYKFEATKDKRIGGVA